MHILPFFALCDDMPAMLVHAARQLSVHLYMLTYMFMHKSCLLVCRPYFNTTKIWTLNPNLHLSPLDTTFCWPFCLLTFLPVCFLVHLLSCLFAYLCLPCLPPHVMLAISILLVYFVPFALSTHLFLSIACLLGSCSCLCMYTHRVRTYGARARSPKRKQKGRGCKHVNISQAAMFNRFRGLASPIWLCTLLNHLPSSLLSLLDGLYQVYHSSSSLEYGDPYLLSCTYIWAILQGCRHLLSACIVYDVCIYIYLLAPSGVIVTIHVT